MHVITEVGEDEFVPEHTAMETTIVGECETHHTITKRMYVYATNQSAQFPVVWSGTVLTR